MYPGILGEPGQQIHQAFWCLVLGARLGIDGAQIVPHLRWGPQMVNIIQWTVDGFFFHQMGSGLCQKSKGFMHPNWCRILSMHSILCLLRVPFQVGSKGNQKEHHFGSPLTHFQRVMHRRLRVERLQPSD